MSSLTKVQRAALMKLADGEWHPLHSFTTSTIGRLISREFVEPNRPDWRFFSTPVDFRITNAGRAAIGESP